MTGVSLTSTSEIKMFFLRSDWPGCVSSFVSSMLRDGLPTGQCILPAPCPKCGAWAFKIPSYCQFSVCGV